MNKSTLLQRLEAAAQTSDEEPEHHAFNPRKSVLHVGSGPARASKLHPVFRTPAWKEIRLDIDANVGPDIIADITNMLEVTSDTFDAIWCSHCLEHLDEHAAKSALTEFLRVLKSSGFVLITSPDLQQVARLVADGHGDEVAYTSPAGDVRPLDMMFGFQPAVRAGNRYMRHRTGFTTQRLGAMLQDVGFPEARVKLGVSFDLWGVGFKNDSNRDDILQTLSENGLDFRV